MGGYKKLHAICPFIAHYIRPLIYNLIILSDSLHLQLHHVRKNCTVLFLQ